MMDEFVDDLIEALLEDPKGPSVADAVIDHALGRLSFLGPLGLPVMIGGGLWTLFKNELGVRLDPHIERLIGAILP